MERDSESSIDSDDMPELFNTHGQPMEEEEGMEESEYEEEDEEEEEEMEIVDDAVLAENWKLEGGEKYKKKDYAGAIECYTRAIELDATNLTFFTNRAAAHMMLAHFKEALSDCDKAIAIDSTNARAFFRKATALKGLGLLDRAVNAYADGLKIDGSSASDGARKEYNVLLSAKQKVEALQNVVHVQKRYSSAMPVINQLIREIGSGFRDVNLLHVLVLVGLGRVEEAYNMTNSMMKVASSGDSDVLFVRAKVVYAMGDMDNTVKTLQQALRVDQENKEIRVMLKSVKSMVETKEQGNEFFKQGQWQNAINAWTQASKIDTSNKIFNSKLYCNCASAYSKLDKHSTAVEECSRAIQADRQYTKAYIRRGDAQVALATKESMAEAIRDYERAYELTCKSNDEDSPDAKGLKNKIKQTKIAMKRVGKKDLYGTLGVGPRATDEEIRKAYKKKALQCHPDKNASKSEAEKQKAEIMFKGVGEAYGILSDPEKKREYDLGADVDEIENGQGAGGGSQGGGHHGHGGFRGGGMGGMDPDMLFQMFMQQQGRR